MNTSRVVAISALAPMALMSGQLLFSQQPQERHERRETRQEGQMSREMSRNHDHGRISEGRYHRNFGNQHQFRVKKRDYRHRRFSYGNYNWTFLDPWPFDWSYNDDVYVDYEDGGYWLYNTQHGDSRISITIQ